MSHSVMFKEGFMQKLKVNDKLGKFNLSIIYFDVSVGVNFRTSYSWLSIITSLVFLW